MSPITSLTSYFNTTSFGDRNAYTRNQKELALTLDSAAHELGNWKSLLAMSAGGGGFELGKFAATAFFGSAAPLCAIPLLTRAFTFMAGAAADTAFTRTVNSFFGNEGEESFFEQMRSQGGIRLMGSVGLGQSFFVIQLLQGLAMAGQEVICENPSGKKPGGFLHHLVMGLQCHFGSGMFSVFTGGVVNAAEERFRIKSRNMNVEIWRLPASKTEQWAPSGRDVLSHAIGGTGGRNPYEVLQPVRSLSNILTEGDGTPAVPPPLPRRDSSTRNAKPPRLSGLSLMDLPADFSVLRHIKIILSADPTDAGLIPDSPKPDSKTGETPGETYHYVIHHPNASGHEVVAILFYSAQDGVWRINTLEPFPLGAPNIKASERKRGIFSASSTEQGAVLGRPELGVSFVLTEGELYFEGKIPFSDPSAEHAPALLKPLPSAEAESASDRPVAAAQPVLPSEGIGVFIDRIATQAAELERINTQLLASATALKAKDLELATTRAILKTSQEAETEGKLKNVGLEARIEGLEEDLQTARDEHERLRIGAQSLEERLIAQIETLQSERDAAQRETEACALEIERLKTPAPSPEGPADAAVAAVADTLQRAVLAREAAKEHARTLEAGIAAVETQRDALQRTLDDTEASESAYTSARAAMEQQRDVFIASVRKIERTTRAIAAILDGEPLLRGEMAEIETSIRQLERILKGNPLGELREEMVRLRGEIARFRATLSPEEGDLPPSTEVIDLAANTQALHRKLEAAEAQLRVLQIALGGAHLEMRTAHQLGKNLHRLEAELRAERITPLPEDPRLQGLREKNARLVKGRTILGEALDARNSALADAQFFLGETTNELSKTRTRLEAEAAQAQEAQERATWAEAELARKTTDYENLERRFILLEEGLHLADEELTATHSRLQTEQKALATRFQEHRDALESLQRRQATAIESLTATLEEARGSLREKTEALKAKETELARTQAAVEEKARAIATLEARIVQENEAHETILKVLEGNHREALAEADRQRIAEALTQKLVLQAEVVRTRSQANTQHQADLEAAQAAHSAALSQKGNHDAGIYKKRVEELEARHQAATQALQAQIDQIRGERASAQARAEQAEAELIATTQRLEADLIALRSEDETLIHQQDALKTQVRDQGETIEKQGTTIGELLQLFANTEQIQQGLREKAAAEKAQLESDLSASRAEVQALKDQLESEAAVAEDRVAAVRAELAEREAKVAAQEEELTQDTQRMSDLEETHVELGRKLEQAKGLVTTLLAQRNSLRQQLAASEQTRATQAGTLRQLEEEKADLIATHAAQVSRAAKAEEDLGTAREELRTLRATRAATTEELETAQTLAATHQERAAALRMEGIVLEEALAVAKARVASVEEKFQGSDDVLAQLAQDHQTTLAAKQEAEETLAALQAEHTTLQRTESDLRERISNLTSRERELEASLAASNQTISDLSQELERATRAKDELETRFGTASEEFSTSRTQHASALERTEAELRGVQARVAQLEGERLGAEEVIRGMTEEAITATQRESLISRELEDKKSEVKSLQDRAAETKRAHTEAQEALQRKITEAKEQLSTARADLQAERARAVALEASSGTLSARTEELTRTQETSQQRISALEDEVQTTEAARAALEKQMGRMRSEHETTQRAQQETLTAKESELAETRSRAEAAEEALGLANTLAEATKRSREELETKVEELTTTLRDLEKAKQAAEEKVTDLAGEVRTIEAARAALETSLGSERRAHDAALGELEAQMAAVEARVAETGEALAAETAKVAKIEREREALRTERDTLQASIAKTEAETGSALDSLAAENRQTKELLEAKIAALTAEHAASTLEQKALLRQSEAKLTEAASAAEAAKAELQQQMDALTADLRRTETAKADLEAELSRVEAELQEARSRLDESEERTDRLTRNLEEKTDKVATLAAEKASLERQVAAAEEKYAKAANEARAAEAESASLRISQKKVSQSHGDLERQLHTAQAALAQLARQKSELETRASAAEAAQRQAETRAEELSGKISGLDAKVTEQASRIKALETELTAARAEIEKLKTEAKDLKQRLSAATKAQQAAEREKATAETATQQAEAAKGAAERKTAQAEAAREAAAREAAGLRAQVQESQARAAAIQAQLEDFQTINAAQATEIERLKTDAAKTTIPHPASSAPARANGGAAAPTAVVLQLPVGGSKPVPAATSTYQRVEHPDSRWGRYEEAVATHFGGDPTVIALFATIDVHVPGFERMCNPGLLVESGNRAARNTIFERATAHIRKNLAGTPKAAILELALADLKAIKRLSLKPKAASRTPSAAKPGKAAVPFDESRRRQQLEGAVAARAATQAAVPAAKVENPKASGRPRPTSPEKMGLIWKIGTHYELTNFDLTTPLEFIEGNSISEHKIHRDPKEQEPHCICVDSTAEKSQVLARMTTDERIGYQVENLSSDDITVTSRTRLERIIPPGKSGTIHTGEILGIKKHTYKIPMV